MFINEKKEKKECFPKENEVIVCIPSFFS